MSENEILPVQAPSWGRRLAGLDGMRGTALLGIMAAHAIIFFPPLRPDGSGIYTGAQNAAVGLLSYSLTFFFVLSAFLLYRPFASAIIKDRPNPPTYDFYRNRVLRVWPAYLVVLAIVGFGFGLTVVDKDAPTLEGLGRLTDPVLLITNVLLVQNYSPSTAYTGLGVSWSLVTEIGFYVLLPLMGWIGVLVARRRSRVFAALVPGIILFVVGVSCRIIAIAWNDGHDVKPLTTWNSVFDRSTLVQCDLFGVGMIAAALLVTSQSMSPTAMNRLRRWGWAAIAVCAVMVVILGRGEKLTTFMGIAFAAGIVLTQISGADAACRWFVKIMDTAPPRIAGEISLSTYLWHYPVLLFLLKHWGDELRYDGNGGVIVAWLAVAIPSLILGAITYRLVELPAMSRKRRTDRAQPDAKPA